MTFWTAYTSSIIELTWRDRSIYRVEPAPHGVTEGPFPDGCATIDIITAHNPGSAQLADEENARRNAWLAADLDALDLERLPALGRAPDDREPWEEVSFAVPDADLDEVLRLGREHRQTAIFRWTRSHRAVIPCDPDDPAHGDPTLEHGWRSTRTD